MYSVGLTGGIGSGKSQVAAFLAGWGAAIIDTDVIAHALTAAGGEAVDAVRARFGDQAIAADGAMDRAWMRAHVFADPDARLALEAILHPRIGAAVRRQAAQARGPYRVFVVPLLVESGHWRDRLDRICVVDCDPETQVRRVQARSGLTPDAIGRIMSAQASRGQRLAIADEVVLNDGATTLAQLEHRTRAVHDFWCAQAAHLSGSKSKFERGE